LIPNKDIPAPIINNINQKII